MADLAWLCLAPRTRSRMGQLTAAFLGIDRVAKEGRTTGKRTPFEVFLTRRQEATPGLPRSSEVRSVWLADPCKAQPTHQVGKIGYKLARSRQRKRDLRS